MKETKIYCDLCGVEIKFLSVDIMNGSTYLDCVVMSSNRLDICFKCLSKHDSSGVLNTNITQKHP